MQLQVEGRKPGIGNIHVYLYTGTYDGVELEHTLIVLLLSLALNQTSD